MARLKRVTHGQGGLARLFRRAPSPDADGERALIRRALDGESRAVGELVRRVAPVIRACVLRGVRARAIPGGFDVDDLVAEVWCRLLARQGRRLLAFDPALGKTLEGYIGMVGMQMVANVVEQQGAQKRSAPGGHVGLDEARHIHSSEPNPEQCMVDQERASTLWAHLEDQLPARGRLVLRLRYVDALSVGDAAAHMGVQPQVVYNWQHKIKQIVRTFADGDKETASDSGRYKGVRRGRQESAT